MKKYKLLGKIWDRNETKSFVIRKNINVSNVYYYKRDFNLLDYYQYKRKIKLSTLLNISDCKEFDSIVAKIKQCDVLYVELDMKPKIANKIVKSFYKKRIQQINYSLQKEVKNDCQIYFISCN